MHCPHNYFKQKGNCNWHKYPVMFMCTNTLQNHAEEGDISVKEVTGHSEHYFADLSEQIWRDVWKIRKMYFGIF